MLRVTLNGRTLADLPISSLHRRRALSALIERIPAVQVQGSGRAEITWRINRRALASRVRHTVAAGGGTVVPPRRPVASTIHLPVVRQVLHNDCEVTALSMVLLDAGKRLNQLVLQRQLMQSPPLDPQPSSGGAEIWGDPNKGFVGRADGGGPGGGYGVYQRPISALARRHGVELHDLTGSPVGVVYRALLSGSPVLVWVALSDGPYATWRTPNGRLIHANYGEHAVVLTGIKGDNVRINDPLSGTVIWWTKAEFRSHWAALGRRALAA